ncbi:hypothetical protein [Parendozoicomonas sp. Alg238-R29]|uniref:hypothetical protein n=1 Tax=Parendozoicomonas sp. Alg238-R29 TaxID=2993446 RepID=UPI00248F3741|nr:hypothetical protein [Parendozoicomonas sp. Alg238-R29]
MPVEMIMRLSPKQAGKLYQKSLKQEQRIKELEENNKSLLTCLHNNIVGQQSAWIEWKHGEGADAAMVWVHNGLCGPGLIPSEDEPHATNPQAYFDENHSRVDRKPEVEPSV